MRAYSFFLVVQPKTAAANHLTACGGGGFYLLTLFLADLMMRDVAFAALLRARAKILLVALRMRFAAAVIALRAAAAERFLPLFFVAFIFIDLWLNNVRPCRFFMQNTVWLGRLLC